MRVKILNGWSFLVHHHRFISSANVVLLFCLVSLEICAGTFYVDSAMGNDRNSGLNKTLAWKSVPGMTGAIGWGTISESNKLPSGTIIEIKAGSRFVGKRWVIDKTYYASGTAIAPTTIRVSGDWGSGNVVIDGRGAVVPKWNGGVQVTDLSHIVITGTNSARRIEIKNYSAHANILHYAGNESTRAIGNQLRWFDCHHSSNFCISNAWQDSLRYEDGIAHDNGAIEGGNTPIYGTGVIMGDGHDATGDNNIVRRVISYNNGRYARSNDGSVSFGFQISGGLNTLFDSCEAYGNGRDGFDGGRVDNKGNATMTFINSASHNNNEDGFGLSAGPTGNVTAIHINTTAANNGQANWTIYDGARIEIYHAAGLASAANIHAFMSYANWPAPKVKIRNSYMSTVIGGKQIHYYNQMRNGYPIFDSDHNVWVPATSNSEIFDDDRVASYVSPPTWRGKNDKFGATYKDVILNLSADNFRIPEHANPSHRTGIYLTSPIGINIDRNGRLRSNPPTIGPFNSGPRKSIIVP